MFCSVLVLCVVLRFIVFSDMFNVLFSKSTVTYHCDQDCGDQDCSLPRSQVCCAGYCPVLCTAPCNVVFCSILCAALHYAVLFSATVLCCVVLCCAVLCCAVLCCAVLCCAVLCCAVLCCPMLSYAMLCYILFHTVCCAVATVPCRRAALGLGNVWAAVAIPVCGPRRAGQVNSRGRPARLGSARLGSAQGSIAAVGRPRSAAPPDTDRPGPHQHTGGSAYLPTDSHSTTEIPGVEFTDRVYR